MKTLVIGMDGAQLSTFQRGWTPFLQSLIEERGEVAELREDLISRGWAEIFTGQHATVTGAMYERPRMDGSHRWTDKFSLGDMPELAERIRPIWQALNERGHRVGIMNVPTTFPAPAVDGFFVSGGGGGGGLTQTVKPEQCYPANVADHLNEMGYILDERLPSLLGEKGLYEPKDFFGRLSEMSERRTHAFISLAKAHSIDFGFVVYKSKIVTTETLLLPELERKQSGKAFNKDFVDAAKGFYTAFDRHIRRLVEAFPDARVVLVSDHSMAPRKWSVNFNALLERAGLQTRSSTRRATFDLVRSLRFLIPSGLRARLKANPRVKSTYESLAPFETQSSRAFTMTITNAVHGVYVNDRERFGGPVPADEVSDVMGQIIEVVSNDPDAREHGISASAYGYGETPEERRFPDVVVDMPDGYAPSTAWPAFLTPYTKGEEPIDLREMHKDRRLSCKAHWPLAVFVGRDWAYDPSRYPSDLTAVYRAILDVHS